MRTGFIERHGKLAELDRSFDLKFWQDQSAQARFDTGRVRQGMAALLAAMGTPAPWPKPRGKAPSWPTGRVRKRRERYEVVKKAHKKPEAAT